MGTDDIFSYRLVVGFLGGITVTCIAGAMVLEALGKEPGPEVIGIAGTCVGALAGLLARPPKTS